MIGKFRIAEMVILVIVVLLIFVSEYEFVVMKNESRAIFLGLWPPTILLLLVYFNLKVKK